jgi:hypothetical protein
MQNANAVSSSCSEAAYWGSTRTICLRATTLPQPTVPRLPRRGLQFARYTIAPVSEYDGAMTRFRSGRFRFNVCFLTYLRIPSLVITSR